MIIRSKHGGVKVMIRSSLFLELAEEQSPNLDPVVERYDEDRDELLVKRGDQWIEAATDPNGPPRTKKHDIERGEDIKGW